jgi:hypothetical protein
VRRGFLARSESCVAPGYARGGWGVFRSFGIGLLVIGVIFHCFFPRARAAPFAATVLALRPIQHRLEKNGWAGSNCSVLKLNSAKCSSSAY